MLSFLAFDVETANQDRASVCQVGLAEFRLASIVDESCWGATINPQCDFTNTHIHGLGVAETEHCPTFPEVYQELFDRMNGRIIVAHKADFDSECLLAACARYGLTPPECQWHCSLEVSKRYLPHFKSHRLEALASFIGYKYESHRALSDAKACGTLFSRLLQATGDGVETKGKSGRGNRRKSSSRNGLVIADAPLYTIVYTDSSGKEAPPPFAGQSIVFTEDPDEMPQAGAVAIAEALGFKVENNFNRRLTYVVAGDQLWRDYKQAGRVTTKLREAIDAKAKLAAKGKPCSFEIIAASEWLSLVRQRM